MREDVVADQVSAVGGTARRETGPEPRDSERGRGQSVVTHLRAGHLAGGCPVTYLFWETRNRNVINTMHRK